MVTENEQKQSSISQLEITKARGLRGYRPCPVEAPHSNEYSPFSTFEFFETVSFWAKVTDFASVKSVKTH